MKKALWGLVIIIIIGVAAYFIFAPASVPTPGSTATTTTQTSVQTSNSPTVQKPPANVGATGVYDTNAPKGSASECAQCDQYSGAQKAQCLVSLNC